MVITLIFANWGGHCDLLIFADWGNYGDNSLDICRLTVIRPEKKDVFMVFRPTLFFPADPKDFFHSLFFFFFVNFWILYT